MDIESFFRKKHHFFGLDIGQSSIKVAELSLSPSGYIVSHLSSTKVSGDLFSNQVLTYADRFAEAFGAIQKNSPFNEKKAVVGIPGPSVFIKRIKMPRPQDGDLAQAIQFEAGNVVPQGTQGVKLDYHILKSSTKDSLDVLLVAARKEIVESYVDAVMLSGVNVGIADVDFFALQNCFEVNYPEYSSVTTALIDVGHRFASLSLCKDGECLAMGDVTLSSRNVTDIAAELNRSLKFLWGSLSGDEKIEKVILAGGNAALEGLKEAVEAKTALPVERLNPFKNIECTVPIEGPPEQYAIALGLALRTFGDRIDNDEG